MAPDRFTDSLRGAGLRVTAPRLTTLAVIEENPHIDAETLSVMVGERLGSVSKQAVYDVLRVLTENAIIRRVSPDGRGARYEIHHHDNHHHLLCKNCGVLQDVPCAVDAVPCLMPPNHADFEIEVAEVLYRGLCSECYAARKPAAAPAADTH